MKKFHRLSAMFLCLCMAAASLAGCASQTPVDPASSQAQSSSASQSGEEETAKGITFPLAESATLNVWAEFDLNASKVMENYNGSLVFQEMEKRTNIKVNFIHPAMGQVPEQFNLMIASQQYPDIIMGAHQYYKGGGDKGVEDGVFLKLNDLIPTYAPNYNKIITENERAGKEVISDTGIMSAIYPIMRQENLCWHGPTIRKDWLEETGLDIPVTVDQWETMLQAMKDKHPDSVPLLFDYAGLPTIRFKENGTDTYGVFVSSFGIGPQFYQDGQTVKFGPIEPGFKSYLELMNRWYEKGLIDKDFPARDRDGITSLFTSGNAGSLIASVDFANTLQSSQGVELVAAPYPVLKEGDKLHYRANDWTASPIGNSAAISTQCKQPEIALAWLDYAFSEEGSLLYNFGVEGETYTMKNGQPTFTDLVMNNSDVSLESALFKFKMHPFPQLRWGALSNPSTFKNTTIKDIKQQWTDQVAVDMVLSPVSLTAEEGKNYASIMNTADVYRNEMVIKFIMGVEPLDKFDDYVAQMEKMGIKDAIAIQQAALDRFNAR